MELLKFMRFLYVSTLTSIVLVEIEKHIALGFSLAQKSPFFEKMVQFLCITNK